MATALRSGPRCLFTNNKSGAGGMDRLWAEGSVCQTGAGNAGNRAGRITVAVIASTSYGTLSI